MSKSTVVFKSKAKSITRTIRARARRAVTAATEHFQRHVKDKLNEPSPKLADNPPEYAHSQPGGPPGKISGKLQRSFRRKFYWSGNLAIGEVWSDINTASDDRAYWMEHGTAPHMIEASGSLYRGVTARQMPAMLRYRKHGQVCYSVMVQHPGTEPRPYFGTSIEETRNTIRLIIGTTMRGM